MDMPGSVPYAHHSVNGDNAYRIRERAKESPGDSSNALTGRDLSDVAERLKRAREGAGYATAADAIAARGWNKTTYYQHENGTRPPGKSALLKYSRAYRVSLDFLLKGVESHNRVGPASIRHIPVVAVAQAGVWSEPDIAGAQISKLAVIPVVYDDHYAPEYQFAVLIEGNSINRIEPSGGYIICVATEGYPGAGDFKNLDGKLVCVERHQGDLIETTIKRLKLNGKRVELWPDSTDQKHQEPIPLQDRGKNSACIIKGIAIGRFSAL